MMDGSDRSTQTPTPKSILVVRASPTPHATPAVSPGPSPRTRHASHGSSQTPSTTMDKKGLPPKIPRHMLDTSYERFERAFSQLILLEADMRNSIDSDEAIGRGSLNCRGVRCKSASRTGRIDRIVAPLRPHSAAPVAAVESAPNNHQLRTGARESVWSIRRASATSRRKTKSEEDSIASHVASESMNSAVASIQPDNFHDRQYDSAAATSLQIRCLIIERSSLVFQYRSQWCETLSEHAALLQQLKAQSDDTRNSWRVLCIQRNYRMHACRTQYTHIVNVLKRIQRCGRGFLLRKAFLRFGIQVRGSRLMLAAAEGYRARLRIAREYGPRVVALRRWLAAIKIQTALRGSHARATYWIARRRNRAAVKIQHVVRGMLERRRQERREKEFHNTVSTLQRTNDLAEVRLVENVLRQQWIAWEYSARVALMDLAVKHTTAHARVAVATRRLHAPYAPASQVAVGLLAPSAVGRADDRWTPRAMTLFTAHLAPTNHRPQSSAARRRQAALSAHSATSRKSRDMLGLLLVESSEAVARCDVLWGQFMFVNFAMDQCLELERMRLLRSASRSSVTF